MLSRGSGGAATAERQLSANLGSVGSASRGSPEEAPGLMASDLDRLQMAQARSHSRFPVFYEASNAHFGRISNGGQYGDSQ